MFRKSINRFNGLLNCLKQVPKGQTLNGNTLVNIIRIEAKSQFWDHQLANWEIAFPLERNSNTKTIPNR